MTTVTDSPSGPAQAGHAPLRSDPIGILAVLVGACCIALAPIMVKLSPLGPQGSVFWRLAFAVPFLLLWTFMELRHRSVRGGTSEAAAPRPWLWMVLAGMLFAADLITWHAGIVRTSAANATMLANLTPVVVVLVTWVTTRKLPHGLFLTAVAIALVGSGLMSGGTPGQTPEQLTGDILSALTSVWYAAYILVTARVRGSVGTGEAMLVTTVVALPLAWGACLVAGEPLWPSGGDLVQQALSMWPLLVLGIVVHVAGQGLLAFALGRVSAAIASVLILIQPVGAALLGWVLLHEVLGPVQLVGGALVLFGVWLARRPVKA